MLVCGRQFLGGCGPIAPDLAASRDILALDLKDVGKIASDRYLEVEADLLRAVVGDVDVLMHAAVDVTTED